MEYTTSRNTYFTKPKDNPKDRIEVEIGDSKQDDFFPQLKIMRWDNEVNFSARLKHTETNPIFYTSNHKVHWKGQKIEAEFYEIQDGDEGASEFNIILKEKPTTNKIEFTIKTKGLDFFYRGELNEEEIANNAVLVDGAVGSYAVYSSEHKKNIVGGKEYKAGKVGQIWRPKVVDSIGTEVLGDLSIDVQNETLTVTIPQDFLDNAVYPVQHAAGLTFGYTSVGTGASSWSGSRANIRSSTLYTASSGDTISSYSAHITNTSAELGAYNISSGMPVNKLGSATTSTAGSPSSWQNTPTVSHVMTGGVVYCIAFRSAGTVRYDNFSGTNMTKDNATSLPTTWSNVGTFTYVLSMYATYSNVPQGPANLKSYNTNLKANIKSINTNLLGNIKSLNTIT